MSEWKLIDSAPWQTTVLVKNDQMERPVLATRGYTTPTGVHPERSFFTSVYTPDRFFPMPAGQLIIPTAWKMPDDAQR